MTRVRVVLQCIDCKRRAQGSVGVGWCDRCGGELRRVRYAPKRKARRRG